MTRAGVRAYRVLPELPVCRSWPATEATPATPAKGLPVRARRGGMDGFSSSRLALHRWRRLHRQQRRLGRSQALSLRDILGKVRVMLAKAFTGFVHDRARRDDDANRL